jgi:antitoxin MazE
MIVKVRKIGNSAGIILSKSLMEHCDINEEVDLHIEDGSIVLKPVKKKPRESWNELFSKENSSHDTDSLSGDFPNKFDEEEWTW